MGETSNLYTTATEFSDYPTGLDLQNLIPDGTTLQNAEQLAVMVGLACSYVEQITFQPLYARTITEVAQATAGPGGRLQVRLRSFPATQIVAAQWKYSTAGGWNAIPMADTQIDGALSQQYWADDIDYRACTGWGRPQLAVMTQYVAGYPNALLTAQASAGTDTLSVDDATGMVAAATVGGLTVPGTALTIYDATGGGQETVTVQSVSGNTVTLSGALLYAHAVGVRVSALPPAVTQAAVLLCSYAIKGRRAGGGIEMAGDVQPGTVSGTEEMENAKQLLQPFRRVV